MHSYNCKIGPGICTFILRKSLPERGVLFRPNVVVKFLGGLVWSVETQKQVPTNPIMIYLVTNDQFVGIHSGYRVCREGEVYKVNMAAKVQGARSHWIIM